jgi:hypothetical protein
MREKRILWSINIALIGKVGSAISTDHRQNGRVDLKGSIHANPRKFFKNTQ